MEEFEPSSDAWNREEEFEASSDAWNREWRSSSQVRTLEIGKEGVRAKFGRLESGMEEFPTFEIGNGRVQAKFLRLESGMEEFEPSSDTWNREWRSICQVPTLGIGNGGVRA